MFLYTTCSGAKHTSIQISSMQLHYEINFQLKKTQKKILFLVAVP